MDTIELKDAFNALPPLSNIKEDIWTRHRRSIRRHVEDNDPLQFLNWSTITATMFVGDANYIKHELGALRDSGEWNRWRNAIKETYLGAPTNLPYYTATSGNLVHQAYHLKMFEDMSGMTLQNIGSIYEFGCGYGAMALVAKRAGFFGDYFVHDFPEMLLLTIYYLENLGVEDIHYVNKVEPIEVDLFVACYSLSEVRSGARRHILENVHADNYLFVFQEYWNDINNYDYFDSFALTRDDLRWEAERVRHFDANNLWYMVGSKR